ncbi:DUF2225 domain-containing protein [Paenibacillus agilis]|uniref:DUF2225 domain-containing protein n=1 Tax=Paenibacillus agilis TaxID=3020863 RepID=A0A559IHZ7_9BACL|nr:DUF2225 domain-containing protein [Paenibacillus agilis]TVX87083.1 DUF2225 domain-containing protein [Paenibacillus agilis]
MNSSVEVEPLYQIDVRCPQCDIPYRTSRVRSRFKHAKQVDSDFCQHYTNERYNPDYYVVYVCSHCGCATTENSKKQWTDKQKLQFQERIGKQWTARDYGGERSWETALQTYQLAVLTAQTIQESDRVLAGLLHHTAWLYRYRNNTEQELRYLKFALQAYVSVFEKEAAELNDAKLIYMMGELYRRLGQYQDAAKCFARLIHDKKIMDAAMIRAAREQWAVMREEMQAQKLETPDEMFQEKRIVL